MQQYSNDGTKQERTGWRDEGLSRRHREWGFNCPMADIDFLVVEYDTGLPVALVEYKHHHAPQPDLKHATYRAIAALSDGYNDGPLPFFIAFYWPDTWAFRVTPVNSAARSWVSETKDMTERGWVYSLYKMRKKDIPQDVLQKLKREFPKDAAA